MTKEMELMLQICPALKVEELAGSSSAALTTLARQILRLWLDSLTVNDISQPGKGSNARILRSSTAAGCEKSTAASVFNIFLA